MDAWLTRAPWNKAQILKYSGNSGREWVPSKCRDSQLSRSKQPAGSLHVVYTRLREDQAEFTQLACTTSEAVGLASGTKTEIRVPRRVRFVRPASLGPWGGYAMRPFQHFLAGCVWAHHRSRGSVPPRPPPTPPTPSPLPLAGGPPPSWPRKLRPRPRERPGVEWAQSAPPSDSHLLGGSA